MTNIFFIDENNSSKYNGIGTFRDQLLPKLGRTKGCILHLISLNSEIVDFVKRRIDNYTEFVVPYINNGNWQTSGGLICPILRTYIKDSNKNVFIINHSPCFEFIQAIRESFPASKIVFVIHDQSWCAPLLGCKELLRRIVSPNCRTPQNFKQIENTVIKSVEEERKIYSAVDAVVCLSKSTIDITQHVYKIDKSKLYYIPNGYNSKGNQLKDLSKESMRIKLGLNGNERVLLFAGRPAKYKGIEALMIALNKLNFQLPFKCVFCGPITGFGSYSELITPIASKIIFTGQLVKEELYKWYSIADFGIIPSYSEQFGYSAIEMADYGIPLIVSNGNGFCDMFKDEENAFVASIGDITDVQQYGYNLYKKIEQALNTSPEVLSQMVSNAYETVVRIFSTKSMVDKYANLCMGIK